MGSSQSKAADTGNENPTRTTPTTSEETDEKARYAEPASLGSGKSSFINANRELNDDDELAAKVDASETTMTSTEYDGVCDSEVITDLTEQYTSDVKEHIQKHGVAGIAEFLRKKLHRCKNVKIKFAVIGNAGAGKSAFINAIRGLNDDDEGAAKVGVTEERIKPTEYQHPDNHLISFWDLPGIGSPRFSDFDKYCKAVKLTTYDAFLILTVTRFTENDLKFAEKVKSMGKPFFLIRTKIDVDCMPKKGKAAINEEKILQDIREDIMENVKDMVSSEKDIFLIGNYDTEKWDFDLLIAAINDALPMGKRGCLTVSLRNVTRNCLKRKATFFKAQAVAVAAWSATVGTIPVEGVSTEIDAALMSSIAFYYEEFGFNRITLEERNSVEHKKIRKVMTRHHFRNLAIGNLVSTLFRIINELEEAALAIYDHAAMTVDKHK